MKIFILIITLLIGLESEIKTKKITLFNIDKNTRGITKMKLYDFDSGTKKIKIWGSCHPKDCFWGIFDYKPEPSYYIHEVRSRSNTSWLPAYKTITINESSAVRKVTIEKHRTYNDKYRVTVDVDFKNANRKDYKSIYYMKKE